MLSLSSPEIANSKVANEMWDGFETLTKTSATDIQFCKDLMKFFKKRCELEEDYSKSLKKLAAKSDYSTSTGTINQSWEAVLSETETQAEIHLALQKAVDQYLVQPIKALIDDLEKTRKRLIGDGQQLNKESDKSHDELKSAKSAYEKACKEAENAQASFVKEKNDPKAKPKDIDSKDKEAQKKRADQQAKEDGYKKQVNDTNSFLEKYYSDRMPKVLADFERSQTIRNHMLEANLKRYVQILKEIPPKLNTTADTLSKVIAGINHEVDLESFVSTHKTGKEIPELFEFESYQQGGPKQKRKFDFFTKKGSQQTLKAAGQKEEEIVLYEIPRDPNAVILPSDEEMLKDVSYNEFASGKHLQRMGVRADYNDPKIRRYELEYAMINRYTEQFYAEDYTIALSPANEFKNRYSNILPLDRCRVKLSDKGGPGSDYINASFVDGWDATPRRYIAAQGPLDHTVHDFWRMIWETNVSIVVMLTNLIEDNQQKCTQYWPNELSESINFQGYNVTLTDLEIAKETTTRRFDLVNVSTKEMRTVVQLHYTYWPDHGAPESAQSFLDLARLAEDNNTTKGPLLIHCSAGIGRTGTFITVHMCLEKVRLHKKKAKFNLPNTTLHLRRYRPGCIQSVDQYEFIFRALNQAFFNPADMPRAASPGAMIPPPTNAGPEKSHYAHFDMKAQTTYQQFNY